MVPGGAGCLSQEVEEEEEEEAEAVVEIEWVLFCSPPPARPWRYGITPAADTTTEALWVDDGMDSWPNSERAKDREGKESKTKWKRPGEEIKGKGKK